MIKQVEATEAAFRCHYEKIKPSPISFSLSEEKDKLAALLANPDQASLDVFRENTEKKLKDTLVTLDKFAVIERDLQRNRFESCHDNNKSHKLGHLKLFSNFLTSRMDITQNVMIKYVLKI